MAIEIYRKICISLMTPRTKGKLRKRSETLYHELGDLESMVAFANNHCFTHSYYWPLKHEFKKRYEKAGLANILLFLSCIELKKSGTADNVVASGIQRFLEKGLKKKSKNNQ